MRARLCCLRALDPRCSAGLCLGERAALCSVCERRMYRRFLWWRSDASALLYAARMIDRYSALIILYPASARR